MFSWLLHGLTIIEGYSKIQAILDYRNIKLKTFPVRNKKINLSLIFEKMQR